MRLESLIRSVATARTFAASSPWWCTLRKIRIARAASLLGASLSVVYRTLLVGREGHSVLEGRNGAGCVTGRPSVYKRAALQGVWEVVFGS